MTSQDITRLLVACGEGDPAAFDELIPLVYAELHRIARRQLRRLRPGDTMGTTGLVHDVYLKLVDQERATWRDRDHFYSIAAQAMRQILVDYAKSKRRDKRGGGAAPITLHEAQVASAQADEAWLLDLNKALDELEDVNPRLPRVVECLYFAGYTQEETARALGVSALTVWRDWKKARAWLRVKLGRETVTGTGAAAMS